MKQHRRPLVPRGAFTLVEMLVSVAIMTMILVVVASMAGQTSRMLLFTVSKVQEFSDARTAFDTISSRLGQATLNTYWDYLDQYGNPRTNANSATFVPASYAPQSDLRFITGQAATLSGSSSMPTHAVFFQAPLGYGESVSDGNVLVAGLSNLLNNCGFFVEFNSDVTFFPPFLQTSSNVKPRYRYRLMEYIEPTNALSIYGYTAGTSGNANYTGAAWFSDAFLALTSTPTLTNPGPPVHILAENVVALILLPKFPPDQDSTGTLLAPNYRYDSSVSGSTYPTNPGIATTNLLPPEVQVTMVALDETSAQRLAAVNGPSKPNLLGSSSTLFQNAANYQADMDQLQANLLGTYTDNGQVYTSKIPPLPGKMNYRIFTTNVIIRAAKWESTTQ